MTKAVDYTHVRFYCKSDIKTLLERNTVIKKKHSSITNQGKGNLLVKKLINIITFRFSRFLQTKKIK
jgi:hypothetical protein